MAWTLEIVKGNGGYELQSLEHQGKSVFPAGIILKAQDFPSLLRATAQWIELRGLDPNLPVAATKPNIKTRPCRDCDGDIFFARGPGKGPVGNQKWFALDSREFDTNELKGYYGAVWSIETAPDGVLHLRKYNGGRTAFISHLDVCGSRPKTYDSGPIHDRWKENYKTLLERADDIKKELLQRLRPPND